MPRKAAPHPPAPPTPSIPPPEEPMGTLKVDVPISLRSRVLLIQRSIVSNALLKHQSFGMQRALRQFIETAVLLMENEANGIANPPSDAAACDYIRFRVRGKNGIEGTVRVPRAPVLALNGMRDTGQIDSELELYARLWPHTPRAPEGWESHSCDHCGISHGTCPQCGVSDAARHATSCPWYPIAIPIR